MEPHEIEKNPFTVVLVFPGEDPPTYVEHVSTTTAADALRVAHEKARKAGRGPNFTDMLIFSGHVKAVTP